MVFLVLLERDGGNGSAVVACEGIQQDPLFENKVVLTGVQGVTWPFQGQVLNVEQWSVDKSVVINWMVGSLQEDSSSEEVAPELSNPDAGRPSLRPIQTIS